MPTSWGAGGENAIIAPVARILIVDDDFEIVSLLKEILSKDGHEVEAAFEAAEGMEKARSVKPDLVILDFHMPGANGAHLFESLRRNQAGKPTPVLFISGEASPEDILSQIADPEHSRFLPKPLKLEEFRATVRDLLGLAHPH